MTQMLLCEIKKVLVKRSNKVVLLIMALVVAMFSHSAIYSVEWIDGKGNLEAGPEAAIKLRSAQKEWSGTLDQALLEKALAEIKRLDSIPEFQPQNIDQNRIAAGWRQGIREIRWLLCMSFQEDYFVFDEHTVQKIEPNRLPTFYENRVTGLQNWLSGSDVPFTDSEKAFLIDRFSALETPFEIDYSQGWIKAMEHLGGLLKIGSILLGLLLSGIFSDEFRYKADSVYYGSFYGRSQATKAKIVAGLLLTTAVYLLYVGSYSLIVLGSLGWDGGSCAIQSNSLYWKSMYNVTFSQRYLMILGLGYIGFLFFGFLTVWLSEKNKSPVFAVTVPALAVLLPGLLKDLRGRFMEKLLALLPDRLLNAEFAMQYMDVYSLGSTVTTSVSILAAGYSTLTVLLVWLCYREYRHREVV